MGCTMYIVHVHIQLDKLGASPPSCTLLKKGCYGNTFRGARRTVLVWHPKGVTIGVKRHPKGVLFGVNILPCGVHKHSASVH